MKKRNILNNLPSILYLTIVFAGITFFTIVLYVAGEHIIATACLLSIIIGISVTIDCIVQEKKVKNEEYKEEI